MPETTKDLTKTSFGLVIAYLIPGFLGLYSLGSWSSDLRSAFDTFRTAESNVGLFLLILIASLAVGLMVNSVRWFLFERWRSDRLRPSDFAQLAASETKLTAFQVGLDENFRYHQFYGAMSIVLPLLCVSWLKSVWTNLYCSRIAIVIAVLGLLEITACSAAMEAYKRYVERSRKILGGRIDAKRI